MSDGSVHVLLPFPLSCPAAVSGPFAAVSPARLCASGLDMSLQDLYPTERLVTRWAGVSQLEMRSHHVSLQSVGLGRPLSAALEAALTPPVLEMGLDVTARLERRIKGGERESLFTISYLASYRLCHEQREMPLETEPVQDLLLRTIPCLRGRTRGLPLQRGGSRGRGAASELSGGRRGLRGLGFWERLVLGDSSDRDSLRWVFLKWINHIVDRTFTPGPPRSRRGSHNLVGAAGRWLRGRGRKGGCGSGSESGGSESGSESGGSGRAGRSKVGVVVEEWEIGEVLRLQGII